LGAWARVWRAYDTRLCRDVAVKVLRAEHADDDAFPARLHAEARAAASVHCGNVVAVYDWGEQAYEGGRDVCFIVMELVVGETVAATIAREGAVDPARTARIIADAAAGLAAAHVQELVHRDIKPANLLHTRGGQVKVADFGISRAEGAVALTTTGTLVGTARYLSPEQVRGQAAPAASDIYNLGIVACQCLAGDVPFHGDGDVATARLTSPVAARARDLRRLARSRDVNARPGPASAPDGYPGRARGSTSSDGAHSRGNAEANINPPGRLAPRRSSNPNQGTACRGRISDQVDVAAAVGAGRRGPARRGCGGLAGVVLDRRRNARS
jgi:serine/threonine protein kinase